MNQPKPPNANKNATSTVYIPSVWYKRIRTLPTIQQRATLAVYLIGAYKRRKATGQPLAIWKTDQHLGHLAFWPDHARPELFRLHTHFLRTDDKYGELAKTNLRQLNDHTFCPAPNNNTTPSLSPPPTTFGA